MEGLTWRVARTPHMKYHTRLLLAAATLAATPAFADGIVCAPDAPAPVKLAAKEVRRYVYLRTGELFPVEASARGKVVSLAVDTALGTDAYRLKTEGDTLAITGGSPVAVLHGAYAFAEKLGVRFYLHGDVVPDGKIPFALPTLDETKRPAFAQRGILPFHDFPEGPDWWTNDDYRVVVAQLAKMRMNFIGMHAYNHEPLVWRGVARDVNDDGSVKTPHDAWWYDTTRKAWGFKPLKTSDFTGGAAALFAGDKVAPPVSGADGVGKMLREVVADAHARGVKVCVGTETPVIAPGPAMARLRELKVPLKDWPKETYKGMFTWLMKNAPVDYYWIWTPETWIWGGNTPAQYRAVENDLNAALAAAKELGNPFPVGTCGWVLGPKQDRKAWDKLLPKDAPIANINLNVAHSPIDESFAALEDRPKWAIPWLENDPDMVAWQPWVKRLRHDAADAKRLGCTGLLGIHWRTSILAANVSALAQAGWDIPAATKESLLAARTKDGGLARGLPSDDFYRDFATAHFGAQAAEAAGEILCDADGFGAQFKPVKPTFSTTTEWGGGPGALRSIRESWPKWKEAHYGFADKFAALRPRIQGKGNIARFDTMADTLRATEKMAELGCLRGALDTAMEQALKTKDEAVRATAAKSALAARLELTRAWNELIRIQIGLVSTPGELGTIANLEMHSRFANAFLTRHDVALAKLLGAPLPAECAPAKTYEGPARLVVLGARGALTRGESQTLRLLAIGGAPAKSITLHVRPLGGGEWKKIPVTPVARAVYEAKLPAASEDFEYYATTDTDVSWPATAPEIPHTVIVE
jgi:hypothetical protein